MNALSTGARQRCCATYCKRTPPTKLADSQRTDTGLNKPTRRGTIRAGLLRAYLESIRLGHMRIVLDAMGSDHYPEPDVAGAVMAARAYGVEIILVGDEKIVQPALAAQQPGNLPISVVHAPEMLTMEDKGLALALKAKKKTARNSMAIGLDLVKQGQAQAFVTAGNTSAAAATAYVRFGTLPGVERPALAPAFPTRLGTCLVLDIGANPDSKPENLLQFGNMGSLHAGKVRRAARPRVGLLSNGE